MKGRPRPAPGSRAGFTLIEILAVVAILALVTAMVAPNLGAVREKRLRAQAQQLVAHLELGRQRAVMTGIPHRLFVDLDEQAYWLGWYVSEAEASGAPPEESPQPDVPALEFAPPREAERTYRPVPGKFGNAHYLADDLFFGGLHTASGWVETGESWVGFDREGTASYTEIYIDDESGARIALDVLELADAVRVRTDGAP